MGTMLQTQTKTNHLGPVNYVKKLETIGKYASR